MKPKVLPDPEETPAPPLQSTEEGAVSPAGPMDGVPEELVPEPGLER